MKRPAKRAVSTIERLSPEGRALVERCLVAGWTYAETIDELALKTGERLSRSAISRWRLATWEPTRQRIEAAKDAATEMVAIMRDAEPTNAKLDASEQALFNALLSRTLELKDADVMQLAQETRRFKALQIARSRAEIDVERLDLERQRIEMDRRELDQRMADFESKRRAAQAAVESVSDTLPPEVLARIRGVYDLA